MLEGGETFDEASAASMDEEGRANRGRGVAEAFEDFGPAVDAIGIGEAEMDAEIGILFGDGETVALAGEDIGSGDEVFGGKGVAPLEGEAVALEEGFDGLSVAFGDPIAGGMLVDDDDIAVGIATAEENDGVMVEAVIEGGEPFEGAVVVEVIEDMDIAAEGGEELAGGDVPITVAPGAFLPAGELIEDIAVVGMDERVVVDGSGDEAGGSLSAVKEGNDISGTVPVVADAAGVGGGIDAGPPGEAGGRDARGAGAGEDIAVLAAGESGGFLDTDDVVFEAEVSIDVVLALEVAGDDAGAIGESEDAAGGGVIVRGAVKDAAAKVFKIFAVGFADLAEQEAFEAGEALAIVEADLSDEPERLAATTSAAEADGGGAIREIAKPGGGAGGELFALRDDGPMVEVVRLVEGATCEPGFVGETVSEGH